MNSGPYILVVVFVSICLRKYVNAKEYIEFSSIAKWMPLLYLLIFEK